MSALEQVLADRGWSKARLAAESGVTVRTIDRVIAGHPPGPQTAHGLAYALGEPVERVSDPRPPRSVFDAAILTHGWTTGGLAREAGLAPGTITRLRATGGQPSPATARRIADAMGVPAPELFPDTAKARTPLQTAITGRGLTHRQVAHQAGVGITTIDACVSGTVTPRADNAHAVAQVLGCPVEELFPTTCRHDLPLVPAPAATLTPEQVLAAQPTGRRDWRRHAPCATGEHDPELWWPPVTGEGLEARRVCAGCPVVGDCRDHFLGQRTSGRAELDRGIWAGLAGTQLRQAAAAHAAQRPPSRVAAATLERSRERDQRGRVMSA